MLRLATGGVVEAMRSYDPDLRVRWSGEKKKWCVEHKAKKRALLPPPVRWELTATGQHRPVNRPEHSDAMIGWRDGYYQVCWADRVDWRLMEALVAHDSERFTSKEAYLSRFDNIIAEREAKKEARQRKAATERSEAAFEKLKFLNSRNPQFNPIGANA